MTKRKTFEAEPSPSRTLAVMVCSTAGTIVAVKGLPGSSCETWTTRLPGKALAGFWRAEPDGCVTELIELLISESRPGIVDVPTYPGFDGPEDLRLHLRPIRLRDGNTACIVVTVLAAPKAVRGERGQADDMPDQLQD